MRLKKLIRLATAPALIFMMFLGLSFSSPTKVNAAPIPPGCPGSTLQGPPAPGVCERIPIGCPGSTQQGPPAPGFDINSCPYGVEDETAKNNTAGPKAPTIDNAERDALANCDGRTNPEECLRNNPILEWTIFITNVLAVGVGVVVTIMIIIGGIQYASAGSNPQAIQSAKKKIANAILALLAYMFLYAFVQYLVPGGIF